MGGSGKSKLAQPIFSVINMKRFFTIAFMLCIGVVFGQSKNPLVTVDAAVQKIWVDTILKEMTVEEKIGQLFMVQAYSNADDKHEKFIADMIQKYHVGNLIFMQGTPEKQAVLNNTYQALAKVPLLIGFDGEWGLDMRLKNTFRYPWNMTLGAVTKNELIADFGARVGAHCKRLGIHINFAPVVDININPKNPIIGNRSFGENKYKVANKAIAFTKGLQSQGVLANAKHFPGHGDTASDSHHTLPVVDFDRKRLDSLELYPYQELFKENLASVMTAHMSIPKLEPNEKLPSSLSKRIVTDLLIDSMGFKGLIITDGLNMKGAANYATSAEINLAAVLAGNDLLLIPQDVPATVELFKRAIKENILSIARLNDAVRKILMAKYWVGLHDYNPVSLLNLQEDLNTTKDVVLHRELVKKSITVVKNEKEILPIRNLEEQKIAYVKFGDAPSGAFQKMLSNYAKVTPVSGADTAELLANLKPYNLVIIGYHTSNAHPWKGFKFQQKDIAAIKRIAKKKKVILDVFSSPYSLLDFSDFKELDGLVVSYQNSVISQEISAQVLFGAIKAQGTLPVSIHKKFRAGFGLETSALSRLQYGVPEEVQMSSVKLRKIDTLAKNVIASKMTPGMQILVARSGKVIYQKSFGYHTNDSLQKVKNSDLYDVASLTKILATLPMVMKGEGEGLFKVNSKLDRLLPQLKHTNKDTLTLKEILSHNGRLTSWIPFYKETQDSITGENFEGLYSNTKKKDFGIEVAKNLYLKSSYKDTIFSRIKTVEQREKEGYKYSDLGYYILQKALERVYDNSLDKLTQAYFYRSIGAHRMSYLPREKYRLNEIVPTEYDQYFRHQLLHGHVHDMGAAMLGGVGGHAGLFSNANDVAKMMQMYLQDGFYGGKRYLKTSTIGRFNKRYYADSEVRRGLGFDKPQLDPEVEATCGCVSEQSYGHSGFTGTYTWADPKSGIIYVFLSNRVYPTMENNSLIKENIRTEIQQLIQDAMLTE